MAEEVKEVKKEAPVKEKIAHIVAIAAGKGGVGKSTVTVNLALALKKLGYSVGVMDTDIYGPSIRKMLPEDTLPSQKGEKLIPALSKGIKTISMAYFRKENEASAVRAPIANGLINQFIQNVEWGYLDFLLIDFPPGTGDIQLTLSQKANLCGALMVTTPQEISVMDVRKASNLFDIVNVPVIGVVENMSYYKEKSTGNKIFLFGKGGGEKLAKEIGVPFIGQIPLNEEISKSGDEGIILSDNPNQETEDSPALHFQQLAENFIAHTTALKRLSSTILSTFNLKWIDMK